MFEAAARPRPRRPVAAARRRALAGVVLVLALPSVSACGGGAAAPGEGGSTTTTTEEVAGTTSTTARPGPLADQTPPRSVRGLAFHDDKLWAADADGGEIVAVDPVTGQVLVRWKGSDGVTRGVEDVAVGDDGSVYWTGYDDGGVSKMSPANVQIVIAGLPPGASAIAFTARPISVPDPRDAKVGRLYVDRAGDGDGLWEIDPTGEKTARPIAEEIGKVQGFDIGPDGWIYGARKGSGPGRGTLVKISPVTGEVVEVAGGLDEPVSAKMAPGGTKVFVLASRPARVMVVDLAARTVEPYATPSTPEVDGLAVAPDGRVFVSAGRSPEVTVVAPDRSTSVLRLGR